ncbi:hypothetical protein AVEN_263703-1 [Araneus ventricosus]|uniref:Uncharacterized protein n=1 Tax=Araneus ventricosus TaxID=182803 RepID=A0A4Y2AT04_ARAVE|nr:hypothetical protein AVEN_263703-1 [Araneus ventricosus]
MCEVFQRGRWKDVSDFKKGQIIGLHQSKKTTKREHWNWLTNTYVVTDVWFHDVLGCIGHNGAATFTTILSLPGHSKPVADQQMEEFRAVLENDSRTTTSLIEDFPQTTASENILEEISALPSSSNKDRKRGKNQFQ